jgi:hypothetical protein
MPLISGMPVTETHRACNPITRQKMHERVAGNHASAFHNLPVNELQGTMTHHQKYHNDKGKYPHCICPFKCQFTR